MLPPAASLWPRRPTFSFVEGDDSSINLSLDTPKQERDRVKNDNNKRSLPTDSNRPFYALPNESTSQLPTTPLTKEMKTWDIGAESKNGRSARYDIESGMPTSRGTLRKSLRLHLGPPWSTIKGKCRGWISCLAIRQKIPVKVLAVATVLGAAIAIGLGVSAATHHRVEA